MVRHHVKTKKSDTKSKVSKKQEEKKRLEDDLENLDRFAGSSDEEEGNDVHEGSDGDGAHEMESSDESDRSGSEESEDDYDDVYEEGMKNGANGGKVKITDGAKHENQPVAHQDDAHNEDSDEEDEGSENDYKDGELSDDDGMIVPGPGNAQSLGMANAMSRILGGQSMTMTQQPPSSEANAKSASKSTKSVILSKTTTPLQRLQQKIKGEEQALRQKRKNRRIENLSAMRLPMAPTASLSADKLWKQKKKSKRKRSDKDDSTEVEEFSNDNALAIASEIEAERTHRRIATRGVVALFNAISKHRAAVASEVTAKEEEKRRIREEGRGSLKKKNDEDGVSTKTKHGFLDMIKKSTVGGGSGSKGNAHNVSKERGVTESNTTVKGASSKASTGWNALKDDFMMNSKLKDWDKEISDDDDEPKNNNRGDASLSRGRGVPDKPAASERKSSRKRQKS